MAQRFLMASSLILAILSGCASSPEFDRDAMRAALEHNSAPAARQTSATAEISAPPAPFRLAVYFVEHDFPPHRNIRRAEWISMDKAVLVDRLKREHVTADIFLLTDSTIRGHDIRKIREAAARYGADAVLIVNGAGAVDRSNNAYAAFYITLIGAYLSPGTVVEALFAIAGDVWDARSERLYTTQTAEGHARMTAPTMKLEDREVLDSAKQSALEALGKKIAEELIAWRDTKPSSHNRLR